MKPADGPIPRLRFPEFRNAGPWEVKRLGEVGTILKGKGISKSDIKPDGLLPCIHYGELYTIYGEVIRDVVSFTDADPDDLVLSNAGDVIIPASGETKEDIATASCVAGAGIALGGDLNILRSQTEGRFLAYYIRGNLKVAISKVAQGDSVVHLYPNQLQKLNLAVPTDQEQHKIADCLTSLDELIRAEGEVLAALRDHKRGLMQRLFPRPGETTPRLRFPEFRDAGPWEVKQLGEVCEMFSGGTPATGNADFYGGGIPFIRSAEIGLAETELSLTDAGLLNSSAKLVESGDVLLALYGANSGDAALSAISGAINQAILCVRPRNLIKAYLYQFLQYRKSWITSTYLQGGQGNLSAEIISSLATSFPQIAEQQKIADCLASLDELIRAQGARLEALKAHKRGLMQQLFPQGIA
jgi:type I restriction enzyme S subunit